MTEDDVQFPNGHKGIYGVVHQPDFALVVPFDGNNYYLVQQFRYPTGQNSWEFPQGSHEKEKDADTKNVAVGELKEETGFTAGVMLDIGHIFKGPGISDQGFEVYLATELKKGESNLEKTEDLTVKKFSLPEIENMIRISEITDGPTVAAYGLLKAKGML